MGTTRTLLVLAMTLLAFVPPAEAEATPSGPVEGYPVTHTHCNTTVPAAINCITATVSAQVDGCGKFVVGSWNGIHIWEYYCKWSFHVQVEAQSVGLGCSSWRISDGGGDSGARTQCEDGGYTTSGASGHRVSNNAGVFHQNRPVLILDANVPYLGLATSETFVLPGWDMTST